MPAVPAPLELSWASQLVSLWMVLSEMVFPDEAVSARIPSMVADPTLFLVTRLSLAVADTVPAPK